MSRKAEKREIIKGNRTNRKTTKGKGTGREIRASAKDDLEGRETRSKRMCRRRPKGRKKEDEQKGN